MANATYTTVVSSSYDSNAGSGVVGSDEVWVNRTNDARKWHFL